MGENYIEKRGMYSDEFLVNLYLECGTLEEATKHVDLCAETIARAVRRSGVEFVGRKRCGYHGKHKNDPPRKFTDEQLIECAKTMTRQEIADKFDCHVSRVDARLRPLGIKAVHVDRKALAKSVKYKKKGWHWTKGSEELVKKTCGDRFEYLGLKDKKIKVKCKTCGRISVRDRTNLVKRKIICTHCLAEEREAKRIAEQRKKEEQKAEAMRVSRACPVCGNVFHSEYKNAKYCSDKCKRKAHLDRYGSNYRERAKRYGVYYDPDVTRMKVIKRDHGICQICGKKCNPKDKSWGSSGPDYPTLDHIIPLAKGGTHTWDNVQCACAMCNSEKRDLLGNEDG